MKNILEMPLHFPNRKFRAAQASVNAQRARTSNLCGYVRVSTHKKHHRDCERTTKVSSYEFLCFREGNEYGEKIICGKVNISIRRSRYNGSNMFNRYQAAGASLIFWAHPTISTRNMHTTNARNFLGTNLGDYTFSGVKMSFGHTGNIREFRDLSQAYFANFAMDNFAIVAMMPQ